MTRLRRTGATTAAASICACATATAKQQLVVQRPVPGAPVKTLAQTAEDGDIWGVEWSPNGRYVAYIEDPTGHDGESLRVVRASGGHARILATHVAGLELSWSPDGRRIAVVAHDGEVAVVRRRGGARRLLTHRPHGT